MDVVSSWTGARADALRRALRMTNEAFAEHLGVVVRTVAYWQARPGSVPKPDVQEALDTVLVQAPEPVRAQFWLILAERDRDQASLQPRLVAASLWPADDELTRGSAHPVSAWPSTEVAQLSASAHGMRPVTPGDLARVRSMRAHLKAIDNAHGGGTALPLATVHLRAEILPLFDGREQDLPSQSLIEAVTEYEHDVGWMAYDAGQQDVAERYFARALRRARVVGKPAACGPDPDCHEPPGHSSGAPARRDRTCPGFSQRHRPYRDASGPRDGGSDGGMRACRCRRCPAVSSRAG